MSRRIRLGNAIAVTSTPKLEFAEGQKMIFTFSIDSILAPEEPDSNLHPDRHTHRDIVEASGGDAYGGGLKASLFNAGEDGVMLTLSMKVNSKVPGTGAAFASMNNGGNNNGAAGNHG